MLVNKHKKKLSANYVISFSYTVLSFKMPEKKLNLNFAAVFTAAGDVSNVQYEISFISETPSLGLESYFIRQLKVILVSYFV